MTTALELIERASRLAGILGEGQTLSGQQSDDALVTLNDVLDSLGVDSLALYQTTNDTVTLVAGQDVYTVGTGGDFNVDRPAQINSAYVVYQGVSFPVREVTQDEYNLVTLKTMTQPLPAFFLYLNTFPLGTMTLWPVPNTAIPLTISVDRVLTQIASLSDTLTLPPGYSKMLRTRLAVELCPEYGREPSTLLLKMAADALADVKRGNHIPTIAEFDPALIGAPSGLAGFLSGY